MTDETLEVEDRLADESRRGGDARRIMQDPLVVEVLQSMEEALVNAFESCPLRDTEGLVGIRYQMSALRGFKKNMQSMMETGFMADLEIKSKNDGE